MSAQELAQLRGLMEQGGIDFAADPGTERHVFDEMFASFPQDESLVATPREFGGIPGLWTTGDQGILLYFHGGGYTLGSAAAYQQLTGKLARTGGTAVFSVEYRLAPEYPFPAAGDDAVAAYKGLIEAGFQPEEIVLGGDSAGGGLLLSTLVRLRKEGFELPRAAFVLSPLVDLTFSGESIKTRAAVDPSLTEAGLRVAAGHYLQSTPAEHPLASPLFADLSGLPPLLIEVGQDEILLSDSTRLAAAAAEAGVDVTLHSWPGMIHDWSAFAFMLSEGTSMIDEVGSWLRRQMRNEG